MPSTYWEDVSVDMSNPERMREYSEELARAVREDMIERAVRAVHEMSMSFLADGLDVRGFSLEAQAAIRRA